jgi:hypothetical protein
LVLRPWHCGLLQEHWQVLQHHQRRRLLEGCRCMRWKQHHCALLHEYWCLLLHWRRCLRLGKPQGRVLLKQHWCGLRERPCCLGLEEWRLVHIGGGWFRGGPGLGWKLWFSELSLLLLWLAACARAGDRGGVMKVTPLSVSEVSVWLCCRWSCRWAWASALASARGTGAIGSWRLAVPDTGRGSLDWLLACWRHQEETDSS